jgi:Protein of unknown function (DUF3604)
MDIARFLHPVGLAALALVSAQAVAAAATAPAPQGDRQLLWGDTHVHTLNSADAFSSGVANADIDTAYRYARGEPVVHPRTKARIRMDRPLDFIVVSDHAENLAVPLRIARGEAEILRNPTAQRMAEIYRTRGPQALSAAVMGLALPPDEARKQWDELGSADVRTPAWNAQVAAADRYNEPGRFTAMVGWEYTSTPNARNLHRVVMTPADGAQARTFLPYNYYISERPEDLWTFFEQTKARTGIDFLAMPHNSNLSDGLMFALTDSDGKPFTAEYARRRSAWEPVAEISQVKGTSETLPALSPNDEFAGFELRNALLSGQPTEPNAGAYVRTALLRGLAEEQRIGVNPFKFGIQAASDTHTGFVINSEEDFLGKLGEDLLPAERFGPNQPRVNFHAVDMSASGLTGAWSDRNDRRAVFDAFRRKEVFGTSGPRIAVRLFAGYGFAKSDVAEAGFGARGYRKGVPMGGDLAPSTGASPRFVIRATKDPLAAGLDRIQVVEGWVDDRGQTHEKIYTVAWSGGRKLQADGNLPAVANPVDKVHWRNDWNSGASALEAFWIDPDFNRGQRAFYYVRVLQVPTLRHHVYDAVAIGLDPEKLGVATTIQERAWSSPVWYHPQ